MLVTLKYLVTEQRNSYRFGTTLAWKFRYSRSGFSCQSS